MCPRPVHRMAWLLLGSLLWLASSPAAAQTFTSGSTGADGPFAPPGTVPPGSTVNGSTVTVPLPPSGIFNFTTITIPAGVTVTFTRNAANTPAILLASGNITVSGTIDVSGKSGGPIGRPGAGGPGGFDGGAGGDGVTTTPAGAGLGPGGGLPGPACGGTGGSYATQGSPAVSTYPYYYTCPTPGAPGPTYGSTLLRPILGGSGGSGGSAASVPGAAAGAGGGGGGALILASSGALTLTSSGQVLADGGALGSGSSYNGGGGSGGAIRLIATSMSIVGSLYARGGASGPYNNGGGGGLGRIRLETYSLTVTGGARTPEAVQGFPQSLFPPAGQPSLAITSIGGLPVPAAPAGSVLAAPDVLLPTGTTNPVPVTLTASNIPLGTAVQLTATPESGSKSTAVSSGLQGTLASSTATASMTLSLTQTNILTATATFPLLASAGEGPVYAAGEEVTHVRVATVLGGATQVTYITRTAREIMQQ